MAENVKIVLSNEELREVEESKKQLEVVMTGLIQEKEQFSEKITLLTKQIR